MGWQPIETAPTDGTIVDLWVPDESFEAGGQRFTDMRFIQGDHMQSADWDSVDGMLCLSDCGYGLEDVTHWMPPPDPPEAE